MVRRRKRVLSCELARRQRQRTLSKLSEETRIGAWYLSLIEQGRAVPTEDQAKRLAKALGITPEQLLEPVPDLAAME